MLCLGSMLLLFAACQEDTCTPCPQYDVGRVEGYVLAAGQGMTMTVGARPLFGPQNGEVVVETTSGADGWFQLDLPSGEYRLEIDPHGGIHHSGSYRDTVHVGRGINRHDLLRGQAQVKVRVPDDLEGREFRMDLPGTNDYSGQVNAIVQNGLLQFDFPLLWPGTYEMRMGATHNSTFYLPTEPGVPGDGSLVVGTENTAIFEIDMSEVYASIEGTISGSWQQAEGNYMKVILVTDDNQSLASVHCQEDGTFQCDVFVAQPVRLYSSCNQIEQWFGGDSFETAQVYDIQPGQRLTDISLVESGILLQLEGPGIQLNHDTEILLRDESGRTFTTPHQGAGPFLICNLMPGSYYLHVSGFCDGETWAPQWFGGGDLSSAVPIDLMEGELREITMALEEGGRIEGQLLDPDSQPITDAYYQIQDESGEVLCRNWWSWMGGSMHFSGLPDGTFFVAAGVQGYAPYYYPGTTNFAEATPLVIADHIAVTDLQWTLPAEATEVSP